MAKNKITVDITADITGLRAAVNEATTKVKMFGRELSSSMSTVGGNSFASIKTGFSAIGIAAAAAAIGGIYAFQSAMRGAVDAAMNFDRATLAFSAITGSSQLAAKEMEFVRNEAQRLGLDFVAVANAYKGIFAASKGTQLEGEATRKIFSGIAAASSALGLSAENTSGALLAVSQMMSKGKISAEELRGQLGERLPGAFQLMAQAVGVSTAQLDKMLQGGKVGIENLVKFAEILQERYGKAAESSNTFGKATAQLQNNMTALKVEVGQLITRNTFVIDTVKLLSASFSIWTNAIAANRDSLVSLVKDGIMALLSGISTAIGVMQGFYNAWQGLSIIAHGAVTVMVTGLAYIVDSTRMVLKPMDLLLTALAKLGVIDENPLKNLSETLHGFGQFSADEFNALLDKVTQTNVKFDTAQKAVEDFRAKIGEIPATYQSTSKMMGEQTEVVDESVVKVGDTWEQVFKIAEQSSSDATSKILSDINKISDAAKNIKYGSDSSSAEGYASGGPVFYGGLPGYGGGDRRLAILEDGEHVIRKQAVAAMGGHGLFNFINHFLRLPVQAFASGGPVGAPAVAAGSGITMHMNFYGNQTPMSKATAKANAKEIMNELSRMHRRSS